MKRGSLQRSSKWTDTVELVDGIKGSVCSRSNPDFKTMISSDSIFTNNHCMFKSSVFLFRLVVQFTILQILILFRHLHRSNLRVAPKTLCFSSSSVRFNISTGLLKQLAYTETSSKSNSTTIQKLKRSKNKKDRTWCCCNVVQRAQQGSEGVQYGDGGRTGLHTP